MYTIKWVIWHHGCNLLSNGSGKRIYSLVCVYREKEKMINVAKCWLLGNLERECGHSLCCYGNFPVRTWCFLITNINKFQDILNENCNKVQESVYYATPCKWRRGGEHEHTHGLWDWSLTCARHLRKRTRISPTRVSPTAGKVGGWTTRMRKVFLTPNTWIVYYRKWT